jgi:hypothetical protein
VVCFLHFHRELLRFVPRELFQSVGDNTMNISACISGVSGLASSLAIARPHRIVILCPGRLKWSRLFPCFRRLRAWHDPAF